MKIKFKFISFIMCMMGAHTLSAQSLPGDSLAFGPMVSTVYHDSVRVWVMTKNNTGSGKNFTLELTAEPGGTPLSGTLFDTDTRLGYNLRSYLYTGLSKNVHYKATIKKNGVAIGNRIAVVNNSQEEVTDFEFLAGGCGRIMDMTRCVDKVEGPKHINGTTNIFKQMASEKSDMMVWLGDAVYLFGIEHSDAKCAGMVNDWDTKDALFSRYYFNRQFHDTLLRAMPQLAITDNHDVGGNEFNKTMPTLGIAKDNFMNWWHNPEYKSNAQGQGLYSSYKYKDLEFFLLDNRSYRESTVRHLGPGQLAWFKKALLNSDAKFKILVSGTPTFAKHFGGRNFSITTEGDTLLQYIKANNIDGVLSFSADIHAQEFFGKYNDHTYPLFDVVSGNLASDIGSGKTSISRDAEAIFTAVIQTYTRNNVYGAHGDRRLKIDYVSPEGVIYYGTIIHEDMLKSIDDSTQKLSLSFSGNLTDASRFHRNLSNTDLTYGSDRKLLAGSAGVFNGAASISIPFAQTLSMQDRTFSIAFWLKPTTYPATAFASVFSNSTGSNGFSIGIDQSGSPVFVDLAANKKYMPAAKFKLNDWTHVVWKYDNVKYQLSLYLNGVMIQKWSDVASSTASGSTLYIGKDVSGNYLKASLDDFKIYGKLISDQLIVSMSEYTSHRSSAIVLSGSQATMLPSAGINNSFAGSFTVECWARLKSTIGAGAKLPLMACHGRVNNLTTGFSLEFSDTQKLGIAFGNNSANWIALPEKGNAWKQEEWNHVALVTAKNDSLYFYINGLKVGTAKVSGFVSNTFGLGLGKSSVYASAANIEMDELRIWNSALSADSIRKRMHYELTGNEKNLEYYYDFNSQANGNVKSKAIKAYDMSLAGAPLKSSTAPVANIDHERQYQVSGSWSLRQSGNGGLMVIAPIPDFDSNIIIGKDSKSGVSSSSTSFDNLRTIWQIDALRVSSGEFEFDGPTVLGANWSTIKSQAVEFYLLKQNSAKELQVHASGNASGNKINFKLIDLDLGYYTVGWKNIVTGLIDQSAGQIQFYPNPSSDFINISGISAASVSQISMHDMNGQNVAAEVVSKGDGLALDVSKISSGIYMIIVTHKADGKKEAVKFVKQ